MALTARRKLAHWCLAQLDKDTTLLELVNWLANGCGLWASNELAATDEDDGQGEAPEPSEA